MKTMMLADFLALAKSLRKWALLYVLLAFGMCLVFGGTPALILFISFPFAHTVLAHAYARSGSGLERLSASATAFAYRRGGGALRQHRYRRYR